MTKINDVVYRLDSTRAKEENGIVHLDHLMNYNSSAIDVSDRDDQN
mgnify:CR=1 FL=1